MTMPTRNPELFIDVLARIEVFPETWDQDSWFNLPYPLPSTADPIPGPDTPFAPPCGTTFCFAGHVAFLDGRRLAYNNSGYFTQSVELDDGSFQEVAQYAEARLGITGAEASSLFSGSLALDDLYDEVADILGMPLSDLHTKVNDRAATLRLAVGR